MAPDFNAASAAPENLPLNELEPLWPKSQGRDAETLAASIAAEGLRRPLWVLRQGAALKVTAGALRLKALKLLGWPKAPAIVWPESQARGQALAAALADNAERGYNWAETALIWKYLIDHENQAAPGLAPILGLTSPRLKAWAESIADLPAEALELVAQGRLEPEIAARLAPWARPDQSSVLTLFRALDPSKQKKKQWLDWLEDIARRENLSPALILKSPEIQSVVAEADKTGRNQAEDKARQIIWARRNPYLADLAKTRQERLRRLSLPPAVRLELDPSFEDLNFSLRLDFSTPDEFARLADLVHSLKENPDFQKIMDDADD